MHTKVPDGSQAGSGPKDDLEMGSVFTPRFDAQGLVTVVTTDATTGAVLMVATMNAEAIRRTLDTGEAHYWSRRRQALWHKGATSGQIQKLVALRVDCDQDALWMQVEQQGGGCCHVGHPSCFYREVKPDAEGWSLVGPLPAASDH